jgi:hypothetical protein
MFIRERSPIENGQWSLFTYVTKMLRIIAKKGDRRSKSSKTKENSVNLKTQ